MDYSESLENQIVTSEADQQRTKEWFEARRGRFTGSKIKTLMGTERSASKMEWGRPEKMLSFGESAIKYIYSKCRERQTAKVIDTGSTLQMKYGAEHEGMIKSAYLKHSPVHEIKECAFVEFIDGIAGSSPDGEVWQNGKKIAAFEAKFATSWDGEFARVEEVFDQKHLDFWQVQSEMLSLRVDKCIYVTAEPPRSIFEPECTGIIVQTILASPIHQCAIIERCLLSDAIIEYKIENSATVRDSIVAVGSKWDFESALVTNEFKKNGLL